MKGLVIGAIIAAILFGLTKAIERNDRKNCTNLAAQAAEYPLWYATQSERDMCKALDMELPADNNGQVPYTGEAEDGFNPILEHSEIE